MPTTKSKPKTKPPVVADGVNPDILILYVIDMSGSMAGRENAVCNGFNDFVSEQANLPGECLISVTMFDTNFEVRCVAADAKTLPKMNRLEGMLHYFVRGGTALRDAIGVTIKGGEEWLKAHPEFKGNVELVIQTDGGENSSTIYQPSEIRSMIEAKREAGWVVIFQGGGDAWLQAADLGIDQNANFTQAFVNSAAGTAGSYFTNSLGTAALRTTGSYTINK